MILWKYTVEPDRFDRLRGVGALCLEFNALMITRRIRGGEIPGPGEQPPAGFRSPEFWRSRRLQGGAALDSLDEGIARSRLRGRTAAAGCRSPRVGTADQCCRFAQAQGTGWVTFGNGTFPHSTGCLWVFA